MTVKFNHVCFGTEVCCGTEFSLYLSLETRGGNIDHQLSSIYHHYQHIVGGKINIYIIYNDILYYIEIIGNVVTMPNKIL